MQEHLRTGPATLKLVRCQARCLSKCEKCYCIICNECLQTILTLFCFKSKLKMYSSYLFLLIFTFQAVESIQAEDESAKLCKRRIEHLKEHSSDQPAAANMWKKKRMDRMMVEHLLRCGYYNTAVKLARQSGIEVSSNAH